MGRGKFRKIENPEVMSEVADIFHDENLALHYQKLTEAMRKRLLEIEKDGVIDFSLDPLLKKNIWERAKRANITLEEQIRRLGVEFDSIVTLRESRRENKLEKLRKFISSRITKDGKIYGFSTHHAYYSILKNYVRTNKVTYDTAINQIMGTPDGTYQLIDSRHSIYTLDSPNFVANNPQTTKLVIDAIRECMDEEGYVVNLLQKHSNVKSILNSIATTNQISLEEAIRIFVPEARYRAKKWLRMTDEKLAEMLETYDDGVGCVDSIRKCEGLLSYLQQRSQMEGRSINEILKDVGDYHLSWDVKEVDHEDYIRTMLTAYYGKNGDVSGVNTSHPELYNRICYYKNFCPGGALNYVSDVIEAFGFSYERAYKDPLKAPMMTEEEIGQNIYAMFGDNKVITKMSYEFHYALERYSGVLGMSVCDMLCHFGYDYVNGRTGSNRNKRLYLTEDEYKLYVLFKRQLEKQNVESGNSANISNTNSREPGDE